MTYFTAGTLWARECRGPDAGSPPMTIVTRPWVPVRFTRKYTLEVDRSHYGQEKGHFVASFAHFDI